MLVKLESIRSIRVWIAALATIIIASSMAVGDAFSATYYVSPGGSAAWSNCTNSSQPCSAVTAMANAKAGDTVNFLPGTYIVASSGQWYIPDLNPSNSGTSGSPITFTATFGSVIIKGTNPASHSTSLIGAYNHNWIIWDGFVVDSSDFASSNGGGGVEFHTANNCTITNSEVIGHYWSVNDNFQAVYATDTSYLTISNNKLYRFTNGYDAAGIRFFRAHYAIIEHNEIYGNNVGFHDKEGAQHNTYRYNFIHDNSNLTLWIMTQSGNSVDDVQLYQNIFANGGINMSVDAPMTITNVIWYNNVFYKAGGPRFNNNNNTGSAWNNIVVLSNDNAIANSGSGFKPSYVDYNNYFGSSLQWVVNYGAGSTYYNSLTSWQSAGFDAHAVTTNPNFINSSGNYSLATDFKRTSYTANGRGGSYFNVMGAYINGNETIGKSAQGTKIPSPPKQLN